MFAVALTGALVSVFRLSASADVVRFTISVPQDRLQDNPGAVISPDGKSIAFTASDNAGNGMLWIRRLDQMDAMSLAGTDGAYLPFWSPDGQSIGFFARGKLRRIAATGGPSQTIADRKMSFRSMTACNAVRYFSIRGRSSKLSVIVNTYGSRGVS